MKAIILAFAVSSFCITGAFAQAPAGQTCDAQATSKHLAGAAKNSFMKKCKADACSAKAVGSNGKPLAGAAKTSFMKKCESES
jgi:hypothetical protein